MSKWEVIFFDMTEEKARVTVKASSEDEAKRNAILQFNGNPPGPMSSASRVG